MYHFNKLVGYLTNPVVVTTIGVSCSLLLALLRAKRLARGLLILSVIWLWLWATPAMSRLIGVPLERAYLADGVALQLDAYPQADIIELHGGSMGAAAKLHARGEMWSSADRVWMAARLWKVGKAPKIYVTGTGAPMPTVGLLEDFGVATNAIVCADVARNTEEEVRFIAADLKGPDQGFSIPDRSQKPRVLVVTSAWHMKRTMLMYAKYAPNVEAIPAPCDFENTLHSSNPINFSDFLPADESLVANRVSVHEWVGIIGYTLFR